MSRNDYDDMNTSFKKKKERSSKTTYVISFMGVLIILIIIVLYMLFSPVNRTPDGALSYQGSIASSVQNDIEINIPEVNEVVVERSTPLVLEDSPLSEEEVSEVIEIDESIEEGSLAYCLPSDGTLLFRFGDTYNDKVIEGVTFLIDSPSSVVKAVYDGIVSDKGFDSSYGRFVRITHDNGYSSNYYCLDDVNVDLGDSVNTSDVIATAGSSSEYFGSPMLYFTLEEGANKIDPLSMI